MGASRFLMQLQSRCCWICNLILRFNVGTPTTKLTYMVVGKISSLKIVGLRASVLCHVCRATHMAAGFSEINEQEKSEVVSHRLFITQS